VVRKGIISLNSRGGAEDNDGQSYQRGDTSNGQTWILFLGETGIKMDSLFFKKRFSKINISSVVFSIVSWLFIEDFKW